MKLNLTSLRVHLALCAEFPSARRQFGLLFTSTGRPGIAAVPGGKK